MEGLVFVRIALRTLARQHPEQKENIRSVLKDRDLLEAVGLETAAAAQREVGFVLGDGSFLDFFQFFLDNYELIFEIITKLLIIFADKNK